MAQAQRLDAPSPFPIVLAMDEEEAAVLRQVCGFIGGRPGGSRGAMDRIGDARSDIDVRYLSRSHLTGSIFFTDGAP